MGGCGCPVRRSRRGSEPLIVARATAEGPVASRCVCQQRSLDRRRRGPSCAARSEQRIVPGGVLFRGASLQPRMSSTLGLPDVKLQAMNRSCLLCVLVDRRRCHVAAYLRRWLAWPVRHSLIGCGYGATEPLRYCGWSVVAVADMGKQRAAALRGRRRAASATASGPGSADRRGRGRHPGSNEGRHDEDRPDDQLCRRRAL